MPNCLLASVGKGLNQFHLRWQGNSYSPLHFLFQTEPTFTYRTAANCVGYVVAPLRTTTSEHSLLNDPGHRYACLHYYAARSTVRSHLANANLRHVEAFDTSGRR